MRSPAHAAALLVALLGSGCLSVGRAFPTHEVASLEIGVTSRDEVRRIFGEPFRVGLEDGQRTWTYLHYRTSAFGGTTTRDLVVRYDASGVVSSYSFNTTDPDDL